MKLKFLLVRCSCAAALTVITATAVAEAPPRTVLSVKVTPQMIQQSSATSVVTQPSADQPRFAGGEPHDIFRHPPQNPDQLPNACGRQGGSLCYDYRSGHSVYKPMRGLLPDIPGLTPHNLSIRRDKIVAHYTFK